MEENNLPSTALVIFGVTGDLTFRKLIPAVYQIMKSGQMNQDLYIIGFARRDWNQTKLLSVIRQSIKSGIS